MQESPEPLYSPKECILGAGRRIMFLEIMNELRWKSYAVYSFPCRTLEECGDLGEHGPIRLMYLIVVPS